MKRATSSALSAGMSGILCISACANECLKMKSNVTGSEHHVYKVIAICYTVCKTKKTILTARVRDQISESPGLREKRRDDTDAVRGSVDSYRILSNTWIMMARKLSFA